MTTITNSSFSGNYGTALYATKRLVMDNVQVLDTSEEIDAWSIIIEQTGEGVFNNVLLARNNYGIQTRGPLRITNSTLQANYNGSIYAYDNPVHIQLENLLVVF